jgi:hypothetical protein
MQVKEPLWEDFLSGLGHYATSAGHALMSEKSPEPDIKPRRVNVAEVPTAGIPN